MSPDQERPEAGKTARFDSPTPMRVLIVDDDPGTLLLMKEGLERSADVTVLTAVNGQDGVDTAEREKPDIILMDLTMPVMDGRTACLMLAGNSATHNIPVIMLTARSDVSTAVDCFRIGAANYIIKPIDPRQMLSKILETLDRTAAQREASSRQ